MKQADVRNEKDPRAGKDVPSPSDNDLSEKLHDGPTHPDSSPESVPDPALSNQTEVPPPEKEGMPSDDDSEEDAGAPNSDYDGRHDPLDAFELPENPPHEALQQALRSFAAMAQRLDAIERALAREAAIKRLASLGLKSPAKLVDAALRCTEEDAPKKARKKRGPKEQPFSIEGWLASSGLQADSPKPYKGGQIWQFETCPFDDSHEPRQAYIGRLASGAIYAGCHHSSCSWDWHALRELVESASVASGNAPQDSDATPPDGVTFGASDDPTTPKSTSHLYAGMAGLPPSGVLCTCSDKGKPEPSPTKEIAETYLDGGHRLISVFGQLYRYEGGVYRHDGDRHVEAWTQVALGDASSEHAKREVLGWLSCACAIDQCEVDHDGLVADRQSQPPGWASEIACTAS